MITPASTQREAAIQRSLDIFKPGGMGTPMPPTVDVETTADGAGANFGQAETSLLDPVQPPGEVPVSAEKTQAIKRPTPPAFENGSFLERALRGRSLTGDISAADEGSAKAANILSRRHSDLMAALEPAYPIFLHLLSGPDAFEALQDHPHYAPQAEARKRKLSRSKPSLLAVQFVLRPQSVDAAKACSDYAAFLSLAQDRQIAPCDFVEDMAEVSLREAKTFASAKRKRERESVPRTGRKGRKTGPVPEGAASNDSVHANSAPTTETAVMPVPRLHITLMDGTDIGPTAAFEVSSVLFADLLGRLSKPADDQTFEDFVLALVSHCNEPEPLAKVEILEA